MENLYVSPVMEFVDDSNVVETHAPIIVSIIIAILIIGTPTPAG